MGRAGTDVDLQSVDLGGSEVPSTPVPPPPNPRASSTSLPNITVSPQEELDALADYCRPDGGIVEVFRRMRKRTHAVEGGLRGTNQFVAQIRHDLGEMPSPFRDGDPGSGVLGMLAKTDKKLTKVENDLTDIAKTLKEDREARKRASEAAEKAAKDAKDAAEKSPAVRIKWLAIGTLVSTLVVSAVALVSSYVATHWVANPPPAAPAPTSTGR